MNIIPIAPNFLLLFVRYCFIMVMKIWQMGGVSMGEVITVLSGKGGTGKTSVCAALATALQRQISGSFASTAMWVCAIWTFLWV
jgi:tetraacyldisaccharide-1-P 4'-kinase